jgi:hypothetical protein
MFDRPDRVFDGLKVALNPTRFYVDQIKKPGWDPSPAFNARRQGQAVILMASRALASDPAGKVVGKMPQL